MNELRASLLACGYTGPCENLLLLKWAIRAGASSQFFNDLIYWLESQISLVLYTQQVRDNITRLFCMLRNSVLMYPSYGSEAALNPKEFRSQTLKVLLRHLQLQKPPDHNINVDVKGTRDRESRQDLKHLTITLIMSKTSNSVNLEQRLVRYRKF